MYISLVVYAMVIVKTIGKSCFVGLSVLQTADFCLYYSAATECFVKDRINV